MSRIEWTQKTWNPVTGCTKVSAGCRNCYAEGIAKRFWGDRPFSSVQFHPERLEAPLKRKKPTIWFVNSMSDLFHPDVTDEQIFRVLKTIRDTPQHTYQVLTKRHQRMHDLMSVLAWRTGKDDEPLGFQPYKGDPGATPLKNLWLGVSVEDQKAADERIPALLETPAAVRFVSCEPLLSDVDLRLVNTHGKTINALTGDYFRSGGGAGGAWDGGRGNKLDWAIVGGESGHGARPCHITWICSIVHQCRFADVPVFVKQLGALPHIELLSAEKTGITLLADQYALNSQWPKGTQFGNPTSDISLNGCIALLKDKKGGDMAEWPEDLRLRQMPSMAVTA